MALAVAIPEGLPVAVTVALAIRVTRMSGRANPSPGGGGEAKELPRTIASDKTGTSPSTNGRSERLRIDGVEHRVSGEGYNGEGHITAQDGGALDEAAAKMVRELALSGGPQRGGPWCAGTADGRAARGRSGTSALLALAYKSDWTLVRRGGRGNSAGRALRIGAHVRRAKYFRRDGRPGGGGEGHRDRLPKCRAS